MSRYRGNARTCPHCGLQYGKFRTGFTYHEVYHMMWSHPQKRRNTILGSWHALKKQLWERHIETDCERLPANVLAMQEIPF